MVVRREVPAASGPVGARCRVGGTVAEAMGVPEGSIRDVAQPIVEAHGGSEVAERDVRDGDVDEVVSGCLCHVFLGPKEARCRCSGSPHPVFQYDRLPEVQWRHTVRRVDLQDPCKSSHPRLHSVVVQQGDVVSVVVESHVGEADHGSVGASCWTSARRAARRTGTRGGLAGDLWTSKELRPPSSGPPDPFLEDLRLSQGEWGDAEVGVLLTDPGLASYPRLYVPVAPVVGVLEADRPVIQHGFFCRVPLRE